MKKVLLYVLTIFITFIVTASATALCPFTYTIRLTGAKVLEKPTVISRNPQNPYIKSTYSNGWFHKNYFEISEDTCSENFTQSSEFQVIVGSEATPDRTNLRSDRPGRNCILEIMAGPEQTPELVGGVNGGVMCTNNIQLDLSGVDSSGHMNKFLYRNDPLRLDANSGQGDHVVRYWYEPWTWWGTTHEIDNHFIYNPHFSTP